MPSSQEIRSSLHGVLRLAAKDPGGMVYFNISAEGFWRSFFAAVLILPAYLLRLALPADDEPVIDWTFAGLLAELTYYVLAWAAFPVAMVFIARLLGVMQGYAAYIIVYNWAQVPIMIVLLAVNLIDYLGLMAQGLAIFVYMTVVLTILYYLWYIARITLGVAWHTAVGIVAVDIVLMVVISQAAAWAFG